MKRRGSFALVRALVWALVVGLLLAHAAHSLLARRVALDTDILALLPAQERDPVMQRAFSHMVDAAQQKLIVLVGAPEWEQASRAADALRAVLAAEGELLEFGAAGTPSQQDWLALFYRHRGALLVGADEQALQNGTAEEWATAALTKLQSPFAGPRLGPWQDDPFGLFGAWTQERALETPVRPRDGRLFVADAKRQYVVLPLTLRAPAFSMQTQRAIEPLLARAQAAAQQVVPEAEVLAAGVVLHAAAGSRQGESEMSTIGAGSLVGILLLILAAFRSFKPVAYIALLLATGLIGAFSICLLLFDRVHLLTLVFGATLIGVAQDYGIYYLCNRLGADRMLSSPALTRRLLPSLLLTLCAAVIGYLGLALTPFPGLRQMAVFSIAGLVFAWLTVVCWYPLLIGPDSLRQNGVAERWAGLLSRWPRIAGWRGAFVLMLGAAFVGAGWSQLRINDDIRSLQNPPRELLDQQIRLARLLDASTPVQFFLVRGDSAEQVLQREEALKRRLAPLVADRVISGWHAVSNWVPSVQTQAAHRTLVEQKLLADGGAAPLLASRLGEDANWVRGLRQRLHAASPLAVEAFLEAPASEPWRHLWLGKTGDGHASIVALRGLTPGGIARTREAGTGIAGVQWVDKVAEISSVLGRYRQYMGWALLFSYAAVGCLLYARYGRSAWRVLAPTVAASLLAIATLSLLGHPLQLFHLLALMLLLGIGVDYGVFFQERPERREASAWMAVSLSAASTLLSFGLLGLSRTPALQAFGLTMLLGTSLVWLLVPCFAQAAAPVSETAGREIFE